MVPGAIFFGPFCIFYASYVPTIDCALFFIDLKKNEILFLYQRNLNISQGFKMNPNLWEDSWEQQQTFFFSALNIL